MKLCPALLDAASSDNDMDVEVVARHLDETATASISTSEGESEDGQVLSPMRSSRVHFPVD